jgi:hypothetical protein
LLPLRSV